MLYIYVFLVDFARIIIERNQAKESQVALRQLRPQPTRPQIPVSNIITTGYESLRTSQLHSPITEVSIVSQMRA